MSDFAYMDMPLQIGFQYAGPLDKYAQFATRSEADNWLNGALSYEGALVRIKENNEWHLYTVNIVNGTKTFVATGINDLELDYTDTTPEVGVFVKTDTTGYVNNGILNTTVKNAVANKLVLTDETGKINDAVLNTTVEGGIDNAGKIIKVNANGLIDTTLIPSIAIGEDLGRFESWEAAKAGAPHLPEHGDTIAIGTAEENDIYICLSPNATEYVDKFTTLKPSSGAVTVSDFNAHRNNQNSEKHVTQDMIDGWNVDISKKLEVGDILSDVGLTVTNDEEGRKVTVDLKAATTTDLGGVIVGNTLNIAAQDVVVDGDVTVKAGTLNVNVATKDALGVVKVGGGLNVAEGVISVDETNLKSHLDQRYYILKDGEAQEGYQLLSAELLEKINDVNDWYDGGKEIQDASTTQKGVVKIGDNIDVAGGVISVAVATDSTLGLVKSGTNVSIVDGALNVATGSKDVKGVLKVGDNIGVADGVISVAVATDSTLGLVKVGENINLTDGKISVATATDSTLGLVKSGTNVSIVDGALNVATATANVLGVVKTGDVAETAINVADGLISVADASTSQRGAVKIGNNITVANGVISVAVATADTLGLVKVGDNIDVADGVISVKKTSKTNLGLMQVGSGLNVDENGVVSANILWEKIDGLELNAGATQDANKYKEWDKVCEVKIFDENGGIVFPSEYIVKDGKTRIEFPADFATEGSGDGDTTKWTVLVGPAIQ